MLWLGNAAYLYLSVSFIQMLKVRHSVFGPAHLSPSQDSSGQVYHHAIRASSSTAYHLLQS